MVEDVRVGTSRSRIPQVANRDYRQEAFPLMNLSISWRVCFVLDPAKRVTYEELLGTSGFALQILQLPSMYRCRSRFYLGEERMKNYN